MPNSNKEIAIEVNKRKQHTIREKCLLFIFAFTPFAARESRLSITEGEWYRSDERVKTIWRFDVSG
jgi:hypothetical protein